MKSLRAVALLFSLLSFPACTSFEYNRQAADFRKRSPITEAESDYRAHNYKIYSAMGVGHYYPGLDHDVGKRIAIEHGDYNKRKASLIAKSAR
jgi:hypothetical protein